MTLNRLAPLALLLTVLGCASAPKPKTVYVLDDDMSAGVAQGPVVVHEIGFWGKAPSSAEVVVPGADSKPLLESVLAAAHPSMPTKVLTIDEFAAEFVKPDDPQLVQIRAELKDHSAVIVSHKRTGPGFWRGLFSR